MYNVSDVLIGGIDVYSARELWQLLGSHDHGLRKIKLDRATLSLLGLGVVSELFEEGYEVFVDAKLIEVPNRMAELTHIHLQHRPWMLNCMAGIVSTGWWTTQDIKKLDALKRFANDCHEVDTLPCAVTVLTSKTDETVMMEFNQRGSIDQVLWYAEQLLHAGFTDLVCSPLECSALRNESAFDTLNINTPGVRLPGSDVGTQARTDTPLASLQNGATRVVAVSDLVPKMDETLADRVQAFRLHLTNNAVFPVTDDAPPSTLVTMCKDCGDEMTQVGSGTVAVCLGCGANTGR